MFGNGFAHVPDVIYACMYLFRVHVSVHKLPHEVLYSGDAFAAVEGEVALLDFVPAFNSWVKVILGLKLRFTFFASVIARGQHLLFYFLLSIHGVVDPTFEISMLEFTTLLVCVIPTMDVSEALLALLLSMLSNAFSHL